MHRRGKGREERDKSCRMQSCWQARWVWAPGDAWNSSVIRKCIDRMQNLTQAVHVGPAHHALRLVLSCRAPSTWRGCQGHLRGCRRSGDWRCAPGHESLPVPHTHSISAEAVEHSEPLHARTHTSELLPQAWERTCGPESWAAFIFLLPPSSSWLFRPPGESQSLSPPTPPTHTHGECSLQRRALVQTLKVA